MFTSVIVLQISEKTAIEKAPEGVFLFSRAIGKIIEQEQKGKVPTPPLVIFPKLCYSQIKTNSHLNFVQKVNRGGYGI